MYALRNMRFFLVSFILFCSIVLTINLSAFTLESIFLGILSAGGILAGCLFLEKWFKQVNLLSFNALVLGLFVGFFLGKSLCLIFESVVPIGFNQMIYYQYSKSALLLMGIYIGCIFTLKNAEEVYFSIPFIRLKQESVTKKNLLFDASILSDPRIIDLASSGLVDNQIIIPRYLIEDLKKTAENTDEMISARAKKSLVVYKKLEDLPHLNLRLTDYDFPEIPEENEKLIRIARLTCSDIFTADLGGIKNLQTEDIRMINIHSLSNALKPLMQTGEHIQIIIQRYGKEPRQGVGYLDDGTMVVVNGGGEFIGKTIDALVLSVKHTSSGRMIFCNVLEKKASEATYLKEDSILAKHHE